MDGKPRRLVDHQQSLVLEEHGAIETGQLASSGARPGGSLADTRNGGMRTRSPVRKRWLAFTRPLLTRTSPRRITR